jgi:hypothetical protein
MHFYQVDENDVLLSSRTRMTVQVSEKQQACCAKKTITISWDCEWETRIFDTRVKEVTGSGIMFTLQKARQWQWIWDTVLCHHLLQGKTSHLQFAIGRA